MRQLTLDILGLAGAGILTAGCWLWSYEVGLIALGAGLMIAAVIGTMAGRREDA